MDIAPNKTKSLTWTQGWNGNWPILFIIFLEILSARVVHATDNILPHALLKWPM